MAKTNKVLRVLVHPDLWDTPAVVDLREKQNEIESLGNNTVGERYDLILGPTCWRIVPGMEGQIKEAVRAARRQKYGKREDDREEEGSTGDSDSPTG